jgi:hypothetical protein
MKTNTKTLAQQIAEARMKGRAHLNSYDLKEHTPLWGMKVWSWQNATPHELLEIATQFDKPVIWIVSSEIRYNFELIKSWVNKEIGSVISFGPSNREMRKGLEPVLGFYTRKDNLKDALDTIKLVSNTGTLLFFAPGLGKMNSEWHEQFEQFLLENQ